MTALCRRQALGGVILTEGTDYTLSGDTTADAVGAYMLTITITSTGDYTSELTLGYWMYCEHNYVDDVCAICGEEKTVDYLLGDLDEDGQINSVDAAKILVAAASVGSSGVKHVRRPGKSYREIPGFLCG